MSDLNDLIDNLVDCAWNDGAEGLRRQSERTVQAIAVMRAALATPDPVRPGYTIGYRLWTRKDEFYAALAAPRPEPVRHPGYVIGSHWLETAYGRVCAGEAEADVLRDCGWERVTDAEALRRDAERYERVRKWICEILRVSDEVEFDAAMDASTAPAAAAVDASTAPATGDKT